MTDEITQPILDEVRSRLLAVTSEHANSMSYYRRRCDDELRDGSGGSDWFFEVAPDGTVTRQMEVYDDGSVLQYHADHLGDALGFLTDQPIDHAEVRLFAISRAEFQDSWRRKPLNS
jgi:hypothetical protein